ncbi:hypothetical protein CKM354_000107800 [Cercospora kikuchii]|uniref:BTB domain-containing protein n=1 Tax=Cercospora kikuchii TaxID=84275 RepID=A0A9P3F7X2_9PEZI|nr:uncharacterized protein CKM354_000107800 [Cercospora kikuchii]GIZ37636.1 hypothetical protein CKM354_000107800 [Cercospora kikuchii]
MAHEVRVAKRRRITSNIVTVTVGKGKETETFQLHDFQLKENSKFSEAALNGQWKEGREKKINLPDDEPDIFGAYVEYLFSGKIATATEKAAVDLTRDDAGLEYTCQAKLYVLGEKLLDDKFCDCALRAMVELSRLERANGVHYLPGILAVQTIYEGTTDASPIRRFLVDLYLTRVSKKWLSDASTNCPEAFLIDLLQENWPLVNKQKKTVAPNYNIEPYLKCK